MSDAAIPIPDDAQARLDQMSTVWTTAIRAWEQGLIRMNVLAQEKTTERTRTREAMPALTMRQTMMHGYVPYKEA